MPYRLPPVHPVPYRYEPTYRIAAQLGNLPRRTKRVAIEVSAIAALSFTFATVLGASSGDLRSYRAYFLSTAKDCATVCVICVSAYRLLSALYGKPQNPRSRDSDPGSWN